MPIIHSKSPKAFKKNVETEMNAHPGKERRAQNLAIAYSIQRRAKKRRMAEGGKPEDIDEATGRYKAEAIRKMSQEDVMSHNETTPQSDAIERYADGGESMAANARDVERENIAGGEAVANPYAAEEAEYSKYKANQPSPTPSPSAGEYGEETPMAHAEGGCIGEECPGCPSCQPANEPWSKENGMHKEMDKRHRALKAWLEADKANSERNAPRMAEGGDPVMHEHEPDEEERESEHIEHEEKESGYMPHKFAEGGQLTHDGYETGAHELDMVGRIMKHRGHMYSEGGKVANSDEIQAGYKPTEFDDLHLRDDLESEYNGANSGDEVGNAREDHDRSDIVSRILRSRGKKQHNPRPA